VISVIIRLFERESQDSPPSRRILRQKPKRGLRTRDLGCQTGQFDVQKWSQIDGKTYKFVFGIRFLDFAKKVRGPRQGILTFSPKTEKTRLLHGVFEHVVRPPKNIFVIPEKNRAFPRENGFLTPEKPVFYRGNSPKVGLFQRKKKSQSPKKRLFSVFDPKL